MARLEQDGALDMAFDAYIKLRALGDAARVARKMGRVADAAKLYADSGNHLQAAMCCLDLGETGEALDHLVRVPRDHKGYRKACMTAILVAKDLGALDFKLDRFVGRFVRSGVESDDELATFYELGRLYERHDFPENATEAYERILAYRSDFRDVAARLEGIGRDSERSDMVFEKIVREDQAFRARGSRRPKAHSGAKVPQLEDLPDLPDLQELDTIQRASGRPGASVPPLTAQQREAITEPPSEPSGPPASSAPPTSSAPPPQAEQARRNKRAPSEEDIAADLYDIPPDTIVSDRYRIVRLLGEGGMAAVYEAFDQELDTSIALKIFAVSRKDEVLLARFKRELRLARELSHENIVRVYDIGVHRKRRFITMELLDGDDLRSKMDGPIEITRALDYLIQACAGLNVAHEHDVVHRDVKPENFFVTSDNVVKVMDFGIAKKTSSDTKLTGEGYTAGTPAYMAPEQITDFGDVTMSCDIYSLGIIGYELLTGELPFDHEETMPLLMMHLSRPPRPPRLLVNEIPPALDRIILDALGKRPEDRPRTCAIFARALQQIKHQIDQ